MRWEQLLTFSGIQTATLSFIGANKDTSMISDESQEERLTRGSCIKQAQNISVIFGWDAYGTSSN
jgi:hypothetical protein